MGSTIQRRLWPAWQTAFHAQLTSENSFPDAVATIRLTQISMLALAETSFRELLLTATLRQMSLDRFISLRFLSGNSPGPASGVEADR